MSKRWIAAAVVVSLMGLPALPSHGQDKKPEPKKVSELMRRKLDNAQKVLEGITVNDFKMIEKHSEELIQISKHAEWRALKTPQYELSSNEFRRIGEQLIQNAKDKNLDGAALNYLELTLTCVKCHKYVREVRWARLD